MKRYKSFVGEKLFENLEQSQINALIECEKKNIVSKVKGADWNEQTQSIDFRGSLKITHRFTGSSLKDLPFSIGDVDGDFNCSGIDSLKSLEGSPKFCYDFDASRCGLRSVQGAPEVCQNFMVSKNLIRSIKGAPEYIFGDFDASENMITNLDFGPLIITGSCKLLGNASLNYKNSNYQDARLFSKMHREITYEYMMSSTDLKKMYIKTQEFIDKAILNQSYVTNLITKNPEFSKFLGRFKKDLEELYFIKDVKDFGII